MSTPTTPDDPTRTDPAKTLNSASNILGTLFPTLAAATAALGLANGDLVRAYRTYPNLATLAIALLTLGVVGALVGALLDAHHKCEIPAISSGVGCFVIGSALLVMLVVQSQASVNRPTVAISTTEKSTLTVEAKAFHLPGLYSLSVTVTAHQATPGCKTVPLVSAKAGQDADGNIDYEVDIPISGLLLDRVDAEAVLLNSDDKPRTRRTAELNVIAAGAAPTTTTTTDGSGTKATSSSVAPTSPESQPVQACISG